MATPLLEQCAFTNINSASFNFLGQNRVRKFATSYTKRMEERPQMQGTGRNPVDSFYDALAIHQEGLLLGVSPEDLIDQRDAFIAAMLGNLRRKTRAETDGTLTIAYAGLAPVSGLVTVESFEAPLDKDGGVRSCEYMVSWLAFDPGFDSDGTAHL